MLSTILQKAMQDRRISSHIAAREIGVSHTTVLRALHGERIDVDTIVKIADWLHVRPSELLNSMSDTAVADQIAVLLSYSPALEVELKDAAERVKAGVLEPAVIKDIVSYALYKLNSGDITDDNSARTDGRRKRRRAPG
jgi:DNA-binding Xre family transcriptional regulator